MATGASPNPLPADMEAVRPSSPGEEELQLQLALAMSKEEHDEEQRRKKTEDMKLAMALEESRKDATAQAREVSSVCCGPCRL